MNPNIVVKLKNVTLLTNHIVWAHPVRVPQKLETKTGEDVTSKLRQLHPSHFRFLKAHLVEFKMCVI